MTIKYIVLSSLTAMTKTENMQNLPSKYILKLIFYGKNPFPGLIQQPIKNFLKK